MDTMHLKPPLVLLGSEGSAITLPLFLLSPRIIMLCHCFMALDEPLCVSKHSFIHSFLLSFQSSNCNLTGIDFNPLINQKSARLTKLTR